VDHFARGFLVAFEAGIADPVGQAVAAEARQPHQVDVLRIVAVPQVAHQPAEGGGGLASSGRFRADRGCYSSRLFLVLSRGCAIGCGP
jgi:hypothetical protein